MIHVYIERHFCPYVTEYSRKRTSQYQIMARDVNGTRVFLKNSIEGTLEETKRAGTKWRKSFPHNSSITVVNPKAEVGTPM